MNGAVLLACPLVLMAASVAPAQASTTRSADAPLPGTADGGWREFRGDPRNSGVSHGRVPKFTGVRWKFVADSGIFDSPAVDAGAVYFASREGRLFAVRTRDGSKIWERALAGAPSDADPHAGFTYSSPLVRFGRVYVGSEDGHLYCASQETGDLVWRRHLGGKAEGARIWSSPKTDGRSVLIGSLSGMFWALDPITGDVRWKQDVGAEIGAPAAILGGDVLVPAKDKGLHLFDVATGERRGRVELPGWSFSAPAIRLGCAYLRVAGGGVACADLVTRAVRWDKHLSVSSFAHSSVALAEESVFATHASTVVSLDAGKGEQAWLFRARSGFDASPVVVGPVVIAPGSDQTLHVLDRKTGAVVKDLPLGERFIATPAVVDGVAFVAGASGTLFAVE